MLKATRQGRIRKITSLILAVAVMAVSMAIISPVASIAAAPSANNGLVSFKQDFGYAGTGSITPNTLIGSDKKTEYWVPMNGIGAGISDNTAVLSNLTSTSAIYARPIAEAVKNQQVAVDLLSLDSVEQRVYVRLTQAASTATVLRGYYAAVTAGKLSIGTLTDNTVITELTSVNFTYTEGNVYRVKLSAKGIKPTVLSAKLYDVTDDKYVTDVTVEDSSEKMQVEGMGGIGAYSTDATATAAFDNFEYNQINESTKVYDDFSTYEDGAVGNDWIVADEGTQILDGRLSIYDSTASDKNGYVSDSYPLVMRPMDEKAVNQTVRITLNSIVDGNAYTNIHPVVFLRINGNNSNVTDENGRTLKECYGAILEYKRYNKATRLKIFKITSKGYEQLTSYQISVSDPKSFINVTKSSRQLYLNFSATQIDANTTKLDASVSLVRVDTNNDMYSTPLGDTYGSVSVTDTTASLQTAGTAGVSYKLIDDWSTAGANTLVASTAAYKFGITEFVYTASDMIAGDSNLDGEVTSLDLVFLKKELLGIKTFGDVNADVNQDWSINILDLIRLKKNLALLEELGSVENWEPTIPDFEEGTQTLDNTYYRLTQENALNIAYFGDSVTQGYSAEASQTGGDGIVDDPWKDLVGDWLKTNYPDATIKEYGIYSGGTTAMVGAFCANEVITETVPDLAFISYNINDVNLGYSDEQNRKNIESMIRNVYAVNSKADIVLVLYTTSTYKGEATPSTTQFVSVAEHYGINVIDLGSMVDDYFTQNNISWDSNDPNNYKSILGSDGTHPTILGHALYANCIESYIAKRFKNKS